MNATSTTPKKPYGKPVLRVYGDIKELTKTNVGTTHFDGGGGMHTKTH